MSRYERNQYPVPSNTLLALGLLAKQAGRDEWRYWRLAGMTLEDVGAALGLKARRVLLRH